eukprot:4773090-Amphidinium_carterae.1
MHALLNVDEAQRLDMRLTCPWVTMMYTDFYMISECKTFFKANQSRRSHELRKTPNGVTYSAE